MQVAREGEVAQPQPEADGRVQQAQARPAENGLVGDYDFPEIGLIQDFNAGTGQWWQ